MQKIFVGVVWLLANSTRCLRAACVGSQSDSLVVEGARPRVHETKYLSQPTFLETFSSASVRAGPDDDNEAEGEEYHEDVQYTQRFPSTYRQREASRQATKAGSKDASAYEELYNAMLAFETFVKELD